MPSYLLDLIPWFDPARGWRERDGGPLELDMATGELSGIPPRAPWDRLERFGRPANRAPRFYGSFDHPASGAVFRVDGTEVSAAELHLAALGPDDDLTGLTRHADFRPAQLTIRLRDGQRFAPTAETTPEQVRAALGPAEEGIDVDWLSLNYPSETWELEFEFAPGGGPLAVIYVVYYRPD
ncbi:MAG TPA: hypothetical protein VFQ45_08940 [Longimicrobium sp.]|nr:hypothetical protein [Longimicrobium sp.]